VRHSLPQHAPHCGDGHQGLLAATAEITLFMIVWAQLSLL
jgi:hypothetical protein